MIKIIEPSVNIYIDKPAEVIFKNIETYGRTCYKSEHRITKDSAINFIKSILKRGHLSVIEHEKITARVICDRGVTHEIVRHRLGSYSQESTRYVNYAGKPMQFIMPCFLTFGEVNYVKWYEGMKITANIYEDMIHCGMTPQEARSILPNSLKTEIVITYNLREWKHFFKMRCDKAAHPQMRQVANMLLELIYNYLPVIFEEEKERYL